MDWSKIKTAEDFEAAVRRETVSHQGSLDALLPGLDGAIQGGLKTLIPWLRQYVDHGADSWRPVVLQKLAAAGYVAGDCTGKAYDKDNKDIVGRYIVGQVMTALQDDENPARNMVLKFTEQYLSMPLDKKAGSDLRVR